jgi:hypothetical protein
MVNELFIPALISLALCQYTPPSTGGGGGSGTAPYSASFSAASSLTVTAATHGQGTSPYGVCYDNAAPANLVYLQVGYPQVAANGDIGFAWIGTKTGHCLISALSAGPAGYTTVQGAGTGAVQRGTLNFTGTGVSVSDVSGKTQVSITAGSGGAAIASGTYAGIPTCDSAANGELYIFTDAIYTHATCNGTAWTYYREGKAVVPQRSVSYSD